MDCANHQSLMHTNCMCHDMQVTTCVLTYQRCTRVLCAHAETDEGRERERERDTRVRACICTVVWLEKGECVYELVTWHVATCMHSCEICTKIYGMQFRSAEIHHDVRGFALCSRAHSHPPAVAPLYSDTCIYLIKGHHSPADKLPDRAPEHITAAQSHTRVRLHQDSLILALQRGVTTVTNQVEPS